MRSENYRRASFQQKRLKKKKKEYSLERSHGIARVIPTAAADFEILANRAHAKHTYVCIDDVCYTTKRAVLSFRRRRKSASCQTRSSFNPDVTAERSRDYSGEMAEERVETVVRW